MHSLLVLSHVQIVSEEIYGLNIFRLYFLLQVTDKIANKAWCTVLGITLGSFFSGMGNCECANCQVFSHFATSHILDDILVVFWESL